MHKFIKLMQKAIDDHTFSQKAHEISDVIGRVVQSLPEEKRDEMYYDLDVIIYGDEISREDAESYVACMVNEDGTDGEHWSYEEVEKYLRSKGHNEHSVAKMYIVMNMKRSDNYPVIENLTSDIQKQTDAYYQLACKFLDDKDSKDHKLKRYMHFISD